MDLNTCSDCKNAATLLYGNTMTLTYLTIENKDGFVRNEI